MRVTLYTGMVLYARLDRFGLKVLMHARDLDTVRGSPAVAMLHDIVESGRKSKPDLSGSFMFQFYDFAEFPLHSIAFSRKLTQTDLIKLVPDTYFYSRKGYHRIRSAVTMGKSVEWHQRRPILFWRGSSTFNHEVFPSKIIPDIDQIPRVRLCALLQGNPLADVGLSAVWGQTFVRGDLQNNLASRKLLKESVDMLAGWGAYKFCIDIDGVGNAWGFFEKLLIGCCVLKVESEYEQWFYRQLVAWVHYIPIKKDLSDLAAALDWCMSNDRAAQDIANAGQAVAINETFEKARANAFQTILQM